MFGVGLLLGIGLGCNSCSKNTYQYHQRPIGRPQGYYQYNQCHYRQCGRSYGCASQNYACRCRY